MRHGSGVGTGRRWYLAAGAAVVALTGCGMALLAFSPAPAPRPLADDCGLVTCGASLPSPVSVPTVRSTPQTVRRHDPGRPPTPRPRATSHAPLPAPTTRPAQHDRPPTAPAPSPTSHSPAPHVTVTYTLDDGGNQGQNQGQHNFGAHLTIVSNGGGAVSGWTIELSLPGDHVSSVGYPGAHEPFAVWQFSGHVLVLHAVSGGETLPPDGTEIVPISGDGPHPVPRGCTFNGSACLP